MIRAEIRLIRNGISEPVNSRDSDGVRQDSLADSREKERERVMRSTGRQAPGKLSATSTNVHSEMTVTSLNHHLTWRTKRDRSRWGQTPIRPGAVRRFVHPP